MSDALTDAALGMERSRLQRLARSNPGVVFLGDLTGQLALYFDPTEAGISRVTVTAVAAPASGAEENGNGTGTGTGSRNRDRFYHAVVRRVGRVGGDGHRRRVFRHPFPALEWLHETVPDFDLLETVCVNGPVAGRT